MNAWAKSRMCIKRYSMLSLQNVTLYPRSQVLTCSNFSHILVGEPPCGQLNPRNNNTYVVLQKLYEELLALTGPTDFFHLGGDEVNLECWAQYFNDTDLKGLWCDFMLQAYQR